MVCKTNFPLLHFYHESFQLSGEESEEEEEAEERGQSESSEEIVDTFRVIGLRRRKGESLVSVTCPNIGSNPFGASY